MIISKTPFRISFFGGGTDYPVWYKNNKGAVLSTTINKYCYLTTRYLPPFFPYKHRIVYSKMETANNSEDILHPVVKATLNFLKIDQGLEIHHDADLPARAGLGSSSSFTVGILNSLYNLKGDNPSKEKLMREAILIERDILKEYVGSQDQVAATFGGFNKITFQGNDDIRIEPLNLPDKRIKELDSHLMLYFTGFSRYASEIAKTQIEKTPEKSKELNLMYQMVEQGENILKDSKRNILDFGKLLHESWQIKKNLTDKISNPEIDKIYNRALRAGAIGGKLLGAGGGGFILFFVPLEKQPKVREELKDLLEVDFSFENKGTQIIYHNNEA